MITNIQFFDCGNRYASHASYHFKIMEFHSGNEFCQKNRISLNFIGRTEIVEFCRKNRDRWISMEIFESLKMVRFNWMLKICLKIFCFREESIFQVESNILKRIGVLHRNNIKYTQPPNILKPPVVNELRKIGQIELRKKWQNQS